MTEQLPDADLARIKTQWLGRDADGTFNEAQRDIGRLVGEVERLREPEPDHVSVPPKSTANVVVRYVYDGQGDPLPYPYEEG